MRRVDWKGSEMGRGGEKEERVRRVEWKGSGMERG
jgi:hypothetical protein